MNKKSQFYMFAAIVLIGYVFVILSNKGAISISGVMKTQEYLDNYNYEAKVIMNNAIYSNKNISKELRNFTESFIDYAENKDIDLGIIYLYSYQDNIHIVNYLKSSVLISSLSRTIHSGEELVFDFEDMVTIDYLDEYYDFTFSSGYETEFKSLIVQGD